MDGHVRIAGNWHRIRAIYVRLGGNWLEVTRAYTRLAGDWKQWFTRAVLSAGAGGTILAADGASPYNTTVGIRFLTNGNIERGTSVNGAALSWVNIGEWITPTTEADANKSVRYTNRVGTKDFTSKAANEDAWVAISVTRTWTWNETVVGNNSFDCDFEVRDDEGALATASQGYTLAIDNSL